MRTHPQGCSRGDAAGADRRRLLVGWEQPNAGGLGPGIRNAGSVGERGHQPVRGDAREHPRARRAARVPAAPVLRRGPGEDLRPHVQGVQAARRGRPDHGRGRQERPGRRRPAVHVGPGDRRQRLRPARGRQAAPARRQPRPGPPAGGPRRDARDRRPPQRVDGEDHPGRSSRTSTSRSPSTRRTPRTSPRPGSTANGLATGTVGAGKTGHRRRDQLLRAGDPRRGLRPGPRGQRLHGQPQDQHRQPRDRLPGPRGRRDRHPRRVRRDGPRVRERRRRRGDHRRGRDRGQAQGAPRAEGPHGPRRRARHRPERLRRHQGDCRQVRPHEAQRPGQRRRRRAPAAPCATRAAPTPAAGRPSRVSSLSGAGEGVAGRPVRIAPAAPASRGRRRRPRPT